MRATILLSIAAGLLPLVSGAPATPEHLSPVVRNPEIDYGPLGKRADAEVDYIREGKRDDTQVDYIREGKRSDAEVDYIREG